MFDKLDAILQQTIRALFLILLFCLPLIFWIPNSEVFELPKMYFVYAMTTLIVGLWLMRMVLAGRIIWRRTPLDIPILLFLISQIASTIYSIDPHVSWFGWYGRFNGGLLSTICYTLLYYAMVSNYQIRNPNIEIRNKSQIPNDKNPKRSVWDIGISNFEFVSSFEFPARLRMDEVQAGGRVSSLIFIILSSALLVSLYALLQHFGIDRDFWVQDVVNRVFSTQGQPNWLAGYIVMIIPFTLMLMTKSKKQKVKSGDRNNKIVFCSLFIVFLTALLFTKSRSGLLGFAVADAVFWLTMFVKKESRVKSKESKKFLLVHTIIILLILFTDNPVKKIFLTPYSLLPTSSPTKSELGGTESGDIRRLVWSGALKIAKQNPVFGTGPETFGLTYWQVRPKEHNLTSEWNFLYNKAHNEWLNLAANTGLFGLGSHLLLVGWFTVWALLSVFRSRPPAWTSSMRSRAGFSDSGYPVFQSIRLANRKPTDLKLKTDNRELITVVILAALLGVETVNFFGFSTVTIGTYSYLFMALAVVSTSKTISLQSNFHNFSDDRLSNLRILSFGIVVIGAMFIISKLTIWFLADLQYNLGRQFYSAGYAAEALEPLSQAVNLAPNEPVFRNELAETQAMLAISLSAETLAQSSLANFKIVSGQSKYNLIFTRTQAQMEFLMREIDPDLTSEALILAQRAIYLSPTDPRGYYLLGRMYGELGDKIRAEKLYRQALELKPDYGEARNAILIYLPASR